jgi:hypothetical protein
VPDAVPDAERRRSRTAGMYEVAAGSATDAGVLALVVVVDKRGSDMTNQSPCTGNVDVNKQRPSRATE